MLTIIVNAWSVAAWFDNGFGMNRAQIEYEQAEADGSHKNY